VNQISTSNKDNIDQQSHDCLSLITNTEL